MTQTRESTDEYYPDQECRQDSCRLLSEQSFIGGDYGTSPYTDEVSQAIATQQGQKADLDTVEGMYEPVDKAGLINRDDAVIHPEDQSEGIGSSWKNPKSYNDYKEEKYSKKIN